MKKLIMKNLIFVAIFLFLGLGALKLNAQTFVREFVAPDPTGQFHNGNTAQPLNPGTTYHVYQNGNSYYLTCSKNCPTPSPAPPTPILQPQQNCSQCVDPEIFYRFLEEQRKTIAEINRSGGGGAQQDQLTLYQIQLMEEQARAQIRQGRAGLILSSIFGAANIGMQGWNNWMVRQGMYRSNFQVNTFTGTGNNGTYVPTDGFPIGGGTGTGNGTYVPNWGNTGTGNGTGNGGYTYNPGDGGMIGGRFINHNGGWYVP